MQQLRYRNYWMGGGVIVFLAVMAHGQTRAGSVIVKGNVSETVAVSVAARYQPDNVQIAGSDHNALSLNLSGTGSEVVAFRIPILIRSNTSYVISARVQSQTVTAVNFVVLDARTTGRFVAADAIANLNVASQVDGRRTNGTNQTASLPSSVTTPLTILSGPRISLSGTLNSADNALEVTLLISVKPDPGTDGWLVGLTLSGSAGDRF